MDDYEDGNSHSTPVEAPAIEALPTDTKKRKLSKAPSNEPEEPSEEIVSDVASNFDTVTISKEECGNALVRMIILDRLPFNFVEREGFKCFFSVIYPNFNLPSVKTIAEDVYQLYFDEREKLKSILSENSPRVCLSIETCTSMREMDYMCIYAHFIDSEWQLQRKMLNLFLIPDLKGETIGKLIECCLLNWGIKKVLTITVDDASVNDRAIDYVKRKLNDWGGNATVLDGEFLRLRCCVDVLNLIVTEGLKEMHNGLKEMYDSIAKIRKAVRYIRSFDAGLRKFKTCVDSEKIECKSIVVLEIPTRWDSTYFMLVNALKYQKAFQRLKEEDEDYVDYFLEDVNGEKMAGPPTDDDWQKVQAFVNLLQTFYDVMLKFSDPSSVTSNICFNEMCFINYDLNDSSQSGDPLLGMMATGMKRKFEIHWGAIENINKLLIISIVLDPRFKLNYVTFCLSEVYDKPKVEEMTKGVKELLSCLYELYSAVNTSGGTKACNCVQSLSDTNMVNGKGKHDTGRMSGFRKYLEKEYGTKMTNEVDRYLSECLDPKIDNFDILNWWKVNSVWYPILSQIARDLLAIPVCAVPSEFAFKNEARVLDLFHSSLPPKILQAVICLQNWLQSSAVSIDNCTEEMEFDDLLFEAEYLRSCQGMEHMTVD